MRKEIILKIILVLIMGVILFIRPVNVFAVSSDATDLNNYWDDWEDQGSKDDITPNDTTTDTNTSTNTNTNTNTSTSTNTNTTNNTSTTTNKQQSETLPKAGLAEDTIMVVTVIGLVAISIYTFKKINEYKNI